MKTRFRSHPALSCVSVMLALASDAAEAPLFSSQDKRHLLCSDGVSGLPALGILPVSAPQE